MYKEKPQLAILPAVSIKTVNYGDIEESTVVFAKEKKTTVQVTSITDKKTKKTSVIGSKILPVIYKPWVPVKPVVPIRTIPAVFIEKVKKTSTEIKEITRQIETVGSTVEEISVVDLGNVKKYTAIVKTDKGKEQNVFIVDKVTKKVEKIQTATVKKTTEKVFSQTVVNNFG